MTRNSAQNRRLDVLRAIVTQYVATREPVGSKAIAAGGLGVSSATIRNDMAVLEEAGLIDRPWLPRVRRSSRRTQADEWTRAPRPRDLPGRVC